MDVFYVFVDPLAIALLSPSRAPLLRTTVSNERVSLVSLNETISGILLPPAGGHLLPFNGSNRWSNYHHRWRDRKGRHRAARTFFIAYIICIFHRIWWMTTTMRNAFGARPTDWCQSPNFPGSKRLEQRKETCKNGSNYHIRWMLFEEQIQECTVSLPRSCAISYPSAYSFFSFSFLFYLFYLAVHN